MPFAGQRAMGSATMTSAGLVLVTPPTLLAYSLLRRHPSKGIAMEALKGRPHPAG